MSEMSLVQQNYIHYIDNIIKNNKVSHAYLIELDDYDNSFDYVLTFIKMILCNLTYEELLKSQNPIIHLIDIGNYPDLYTISSNTSVINKSLITDLQKEFNNKSNFDNKRIYIIKEAEKLNPASANTILKFLEEPEDDIVAILLTDDRYHVIDTIISRCQILTLKENKIFDQIDDDFIDILDSILNPTNFFIKYNMYSKEIFTDKNILLSRFHMVEKIILSYLSLDNEENDYYNILSKYDESKLVNILNIMEDEFPKLKFNVNFKLWMDSFFSRLIGG